MPVSVLENGKLKLIMRKNYVFAKVRRQPDELGLKDKVDRVKNTRDIAGVAREIRKSNEYVERRRSMGEKAYMPVTLKQKDIAMLRSEASAEISKQ